MANKMADELKNSTLYTKDEIDALRTQLSTFANEPRQTFTLREGIQELLPELLTALKHHSHRDVADLLSKQGFEISESSLKQYISRMQNPKVDKAKQSDTARSEKSNRGGKGRGRRAANDSNQATDNSNSSEVAVAESESSSPQTVSHPDKTHSSASSTDSKAKRGSQSHGANQTASQNASQSAGQKLAGQFNE